MVVSFVNRGKIFRNWCCYVLLNVCFKLMKNLGKVGLNEEEIL